jgi:hypothetical protein
MPILVTDWVFLATTNLLLVTPTGGYDFCYGKQARQSRILNQEASRIGRESTSSEVFCCCRELWLVCCFLHMVTRKLLE